MWSRLLALAGSGQDLALDAATGGLLALGVNDAKKSGPSHAAANMPRQRKTAVAQARRKAQKTSPASSKRRQAPGSMSKTTLPPCRASR